MTDRAVPRLDDGACTVYLGDCVAVLPTMDDHSVDAVITDPPYGLGFMGKDWDSPGGVGDFPMRRFDAMNMVNTGASRQGGRQRSTEDFAKRQARDARSYQEWCEQWARECLRVLKPGGHLLAFGGTRTYHRLASAIEDAGFELRDSITWLYGSGFPKSLDVSKAIDRAAGVEREVVDSYERKGRAAGIMGRETEIVREITELKPASEPIVVARKSLVGTVAANVLEHGTGALNIDACRVPTEDVLTGSGAPPLRFGGTNARPFHEGATLTGVNQHDAGRWPTNVVLDDTTADALDAQTGVLVSGANPTRRGSDKFRDAYGEFQGQEECEPARGADSGGASRFFPVFRYQAKADQDERPRVGLVAHPTVKPVDLMRWLVRLVTPPGGIVLDPFLGSGTTAEACVAEGFRCIGIEREEDYMGLIEARLSKPIQVGFGFGEGAA